MLPAIGVRFPEESTSTTCGKELMASAQKIKFPELSIVTGPGLPICVLNAAPAWIAVWLDGKFALPATVASKPFESILCTAEPSPKYTTPAAFTASPVTYPSTADAAGVP